MSETPHSVAIFERLRAEILNLERTPGARLTERTLEAEFGASRTPVRAALIRLEAESLVERDGRAWQITPIDLTEISGLSELREAVETAAVRLACERATDDDVEALRELVAEFTAESTNEDVVSAGTDFHVALASLAGNPFLAGCVETTLTRLARTRWLEVRTIEERRIAWREHQQIVERISARDAEGAADMARAHIVATRERLIASLGADQRLLRAQGLTIIGR
jgi:DNA-binding GntR family transcriptional regulator